MTEGLLADLRHEDWIVRRQAVIHLGQLPQTSPRVIIGLLTALKDGHYAVRSSAAASLGQQGQQWQATSDITSDIIDGLLVASKDAKWQVRRSAAVSLGQLGRASQSVVNGLLALLNDEDSDVCTSAIISLGQLGASTPDMMARLLPLLHLGNLSSTIVIEELLAALEDKNRKVRYQAAEFLGQIEQAPTSVIDGLLKRLNDKREHGDVRLCAAESLVKLEQVTLDVVEGLLSALEDPYIPSLFKVVGEQEEREEEW